MDLRSLRNVNTLLPKVKNAAIEWYEKCHEQKINVVIICGTRTYAEQDKIYSQGRTTPGKIVTNARGGYSNHNFGVAWDFVVFEGVNKNGGTGQPLWNSKDMDRAGKIAEDMGLEWGGNWKFIDKPHIQWKHGLTMAELRRRVANKIPII